MKKPKDKDVAISGAEASAEAMRQINPDVVAAYPITPSTQIMEDFSKYLADGEVDTELIRVESEHSAMSACVGASAAGARVMTATSSAGLALMWEILGVASGLRLPIVLSLVNRALSAPINIHCDHSDVMGARDQGWIIMFSETNQEVYDQTLLSVKLAEATRVPVMVCQDGFISSHGVQKVHVYADSKIKKFVGDFKPERYLLDTKNPYTVGPLQLTDYYFETKEQHEEAMLAAKDEFIKIGKELTKITGKEYGPIEAYMTDDAEAIVIATNSTAGTLKAVVDDFREKGKKVGMVKIRLFRPFPYEEVSEAIKGAKAVAVMDRAESHGAMPPMYSDVLNSTWLLKDKPVMQSCVFGLGGREIMEHHVEELYDNLLKGKIDSWKIHLNLREK